jgi:hypothetical protein
LEIEFGRTKGGLGLVSPYDPPTVKYRTGADILLQQYISLSLQPLPCPLPDNGLPHQGFCRRGFEAPDLTTPERLYVARSRQVCIYLVEALLVAIYLTEKKDVYIHI